MKILVAYYSKTGTTRKVAQAVIAEKNCDFDEVHFDEKTKLIDYVRDPSEYERVVLLAPVWAFSLAEPMKMYVAENKSKIKQYDLIVTCGAFGLRGCIKHCSSSIGKRPDNAVKLKAKDVKRDSYDIGAILYSFYS